MSAMAKAADNTAASPLLPNLLERCHVGLNAAETIVETARRTVAARVTSAGKIDAAAFDRAQFAAHGFAWLATYATALAQLLSWAERLNETERFGEVEALILQIGFGEYLAQIGGGFPMSQGEIVRPADLGLTGADLRPLEAVQDLVSQGNTAETRTALAIHLSEAQFGEAALDDEALGIIRDQFHGFAEAHREAAHQWHLKDALIPLEVIEQLAEMGVFGLTVPEDFGGAGLGKLAMCVVTEELSRGYIGLGSLGTRSEIAAELIRLGGTEAQKQKWLPKLASGEILPTAVFTEPNTGSDLGSLRTRAERHGDIYRITGNKTWITHAARSDVMTLLARTDPNEPGYKGLSMFLAEKPRGTDGSPFPIKGMSGSEIRVLGYRGMKEYELAFDGFEVKAENLLGGVEGEGFKQLMATFESARIQKIGRAHV